MKPDPVSLALRGGLLTIRLIFCISLLGCTIGPKYQAPLIHPPLAYKEPDPTGWGPATPADAVLRGRWWEMYGDEQLNALEDRLEAGSQSVAAALARYDAARAIVRQTRSQYLPTVATSPALSNTRIAVSPYAASGAGTTYTEYSFPVTATWEPDLWGRVRRSVAANAYTAQSLHADLENVRLLCHANLAAAYVQLRGVESQQAILHATLMAWRRNLDLTRGLMHSGLSTDEAVAAAESQLAAAEAQNTNLGIARAQYEHAIATLLGEPPSTFALPVATHRLHLPNIPIGVPASLLQRRPDISEAERAMASANTQIGIAKAAYFPNVLLGASGGIESLSAANWFSWPSRFWSVGPSAVETLFDGGLRKANVAQYRALYQESVANYRQTTLTAFQQVEDELAAMRILSLDLQEQGAAVQSGERYLSQANARQRAGLDPYLNVLTAQLNLLAHKETYAAFETQQQLASIRLIEALGGGWDTSRQPSLHDVSH